MGDAAIVKGSIKSVFSLQYRLRHRLLSLRMLITHKCVRPLEVEVVVDLIIQLSLYQSTGLTDNYSVSKIIRYMDLLLTHPRVVVQALAHIRILKELHTSLVTTSPHSANQGIDLLQIFTRCYHIYLEEVLKGITRAGPDRISQILPQFFLHHEGSLHHPATRQMPLSDIQSQLQVRFINLALLALQGVHHLNIQWIVLQVFHLIKLSILQCGQGHNDPSLRDHHLQARLLPKHLHCDWAFQVFLNHRVCKDLPMTTRC